MEECLANKIKRFIKGEPASGDLYISKDAVQFTDNENDARAICLSSRRSGRQKNYFDLLKGLTLVHKGMPNVNFLFANNNVFG